MNTYADTFDTADNPLISALGPFRSSAELARLLQYSPLDGVDVAELNEDSRTTYLGQFKSLFIPTLSAMEIATNLQAMLRSGYVLRNPYLLAARQRMYQLSPERWESLADLPAYDMSASGLTTTGVTGLGKTTVIMRPLSLLPQVIEHGPDERAGWARQRQVVWLYVEMPHDGSRSGLLAGILSALDKALGTNDMPEIIRQFRRIDEREVAVAMKLTSCYTGIIVFDESQRGNVTHSSHSRVLQLFFLKLMNMGIPLVFSGNPQALAPLIGHAQNIRRFCSEGFLLMEPAVDEENEDWDEYLVPGMWNYSVMPRATPLTPQIRAKLKRYSGGFPGLLRQVIKGTQKDALLRGDDAVTEEHLDRYYKSTEMQLFHDLIKGFLTKNAKLLKRYDDIPAKYYDELWKNEKASEQDADAPQDESTGATPDQEGYDLAKRERARAKARATRKKREEERIRILQETAPVDDLRAATGPEAHVAGFESISDK